MTHISYMSGLNTPVNEWKQRGALVAVKPNYIPYTQMTKGELRLALALQNLQIDRSFYPESKELQQAAVMVENALYGGVNRGVSFVGAIGDNLQPIARLIMQASRENTPASQYGMMNRNTVGVRIGEPIVPIKYTGVDCEKFIYEDFKKYYYKYRSTVAWYKRVNYLLPSGNVKLDSKYWKGFNGDKNVGAKYQEMLLDCEFRKNVEVILNANLETGSPHMLYHNMRAAFEPALGTLAQTKRLLHKAGVSDIAKVAGFDGDLMSQWVETGIKRDVVARGVDPSFAFSPVLSAMIMPEGAEKWANNELQEIKKRGGAQSIGFVLTTAMVTAIFGGIAVALKAAAELQNSFNAKKINALQNAQGFGTTAFQPEKEDFLKSKNDTSLQVPGGNTTLLIGGALAAYLLLKK